jgi:hypothetical protein
MSRDTVTNDDLMQNLLKQLTAKERIILADLWESDARPVIEKLLGQRQLQIAQLVLKASADHYYTVEHRGRSLELANLAKILSDNLKKENKAREAASNQ